MTLVADTAQAGRGELSCLVNYAGRNVPVRIDARGVNIYGLVFTPQSGGEHKVSVFYSGVEVHGSPFIVDVMDTTQIGVSGEGLQVAAVGRLTTFLIHTPNVNIHDLEVNLTTPRGRTNPVRLYDRGQGTFEAEFTAADVGEHTIEVKLMGRQVAESPWKCQAFDASKIYVSSIPTHTKEKMVEFDIDASKAGSGNLEIMVNQGTEECAVQSFGNQKFRAQFEAVPAKTYTIDMKFNGEVVPGSPWKVNTMDPNKVRCTDLTSNRMFAVREKASIEVNTTDAGEGRLKATLTIPSGQKIPCDVYETSPGMYKVEFTVTDAGVHVLEILFGGHHIPGSPFTFKVFDIGQINVKGLRHDGIGGLVGQPVAFDVDASQAGHGNLEIMVNGGYVECAAQSVGHQKFKAQFVPKQAKRHTVEVKFNGEPVNGSPWAFDVIDPSAITVSGEGIRNSMLNKPTWFDINTGGLDNELLEVKMKAPSGKEATLHTRELMHGVYRAEHTLTEHGYHALDVSYGGYAVQGSPYTIRPFNPGDIKVADMPTVCNLGDPVNFTVDAAKAGSGNLEIMVNGGHVDCEVTDLGHQRFRARFTPTEASDHIIDMRFNSQPVPGSPWQVRVEEGDISRIRAYGEGLTSARMHQLSAFDVDTGGLFGSKITANLRSPSGRSMPCRVVETTKGQYKPDFIVTEPGTHYLDVMYGPRPIKGSPFKIEVADPSLIRVDLQDKRGLIGKPVYFSVDAAKAGSGNLEIMVNGGHVDCEVSNLGNQRFRAHFVPEEPVPHNIEMHFNGQPIPGSPWQVLIEEEDISRIRVYDEGLSNVRLHQSAAFDVDTGGLYGSKITADLRSPSGRTTPCRVSEPVRGQFKVDFVVTEAGSPWQILVEEEDISRIRAYGEGLTNVRMHQSSAFEVDTGGLYSSKITADLRAPSGRTTPCRVNETARGQYKVDFVVTEAGTNYLDVKYGDRPIRGSPFTIKVSDPGLVRVDLQDRMKVKIGDPVTFNVDAAQAGSGNLEIMVNSGYVNCDVTETGKQRFKGRFIAEKPITHTVEMRFNDQPVPGSPWQIFVEEEDISRIRAYGEGLTNVRMHQSSAFEVDTGGKTSAGFVLMEKA
ncbi:PREDICTED: filamin-B-like [Priapulus caudatus]|uniref:Filamin-B-like n=1 Tax=Priapulus caudatus TaxID=37621 RepID=A0ABM1E9P0_PRICU|nr:PREDICTED: filamin-B-like [Priapulus caudatus]